MTQTGFENSSTETLLIIRENLLRGIDVAVAHIEAGTLDYVSPEDLKDKKSPPRVFGWLTVMLLNNVESVLDSRNAI